MSENTLELLTNEKGHGLKLSVSPYDEYVLHVNDLFSVHLTQKELEQLSDKLVKIASCMSVKIKNNESVRPKIEKCIKKIKKCEKRIKETILLEETYNDSFLHGIREILPDANLDEVKEAIIKNWMT